MANLSFKIATNTVCSSIFQARFYWQFSLVNCWLRKASRIQIIDTEYLDKEASEHQDLKDGRAGDASECWSAGSVLGARHSSAPGVWLIRSAFPFVFKLDRRNRSPRSLLVSIHLLNENLSSTPSCRLSRRSLGGASSARAATYTIPQRFPHCTSHQLHQASHLGALKNGWKRTCRTKAMLTLQTLPACISGRKMSYEICHVVFQTSGKVVQ